MYVASKARGDSVCSDCSECDRRVITHVVVMVLKGRGSVHFAPTTRYVSGGLGELYLLGLADSCWREIA
jgi:hypothetical protein